jgi:hypothetical protein
VGELRSAIDAFGIRDVADKPDAMLEEDFAELQRVAELLEVERLRHLAEIERRGIHQRDGHLSAASWYATTFRIGWGQAKSDLRTAKAVEDMPETKKALEAGDVSLAAAKVLVQAREADPEAFSRCEPDLVETARIHNMRDLQRVLTGWRQMVDRERGLDAEAELRDMRRLFTSRTFGGMVRVDGDLDPETGETLLTALRAVMDAEARSGTEDSRSPAQRRADALAEVCRQWLDRSGRPVVGGERPHVALTVSAEALRNMQGSAELDQVGPVPIEVARRIACDAAIVRVVTAGASEPLDLGRRTPVISSAQRRAVVLRDRHCRFPACDRPPEWCDAHHIVHWADGGPTDLCNLILLCRRHHTMLHARKGFTLALEDGRPEFKRPDGTVLESRAPP